MKQFIVSLALGLASGAYADEETSTKDTEQRVKDQHPAEPTRESKTS